MGKPRGPNDHVPPGERQDHPAVQRMKRQKMLKTLKRWCFLLLVLGCLLGAYAWNWKTKNDGKELSAQNVFEDLVKDATGGATEAWKALEEAYERRTTTPSDAELDAMVTKSRAKPPDAATPAPTADPPNPGAEPTPPAPAPGPSPAEAPAPQLSPEEQAAKKAIQDANKAYEESREHYDKFKSSKDPAVRKREINAAFDAMQKAKEGYQKAQEQYHVESDWLTQRLQECLQTYKLLKNAKGAN